MAVSVGIGGEMGREMGRGEYQSIRSSFAPTWIAGLVVFFIRLCFFQKPKCALLRLSFFFLKLTQTIGQSTHIMYNLKSVRTRIK